MRRAHLTLERPETAKAVDHTANPKRRPANTALLAVAAFAVCVATSCTRDVPRVRAACVTVTFLPDTPVDAIAAYWAGATSAAGRRVEASRYDGASKTILALFKSQTEAKAFTHQAENFGTKSPAPLKLIRNVTSTAKVRDCASLHNSSDRTED